MPMQKINQVDERANESELSALPLRIEHLRDGRAAIFGGYVDNHVGVLQEASHIGLVLAHLPKGILIPLCGLLQLFKAVVKFFGHELHFWYVICLSELLCKVNWTYEYKF